MDHVFKTSQTLCFSFTYFVCYKCKCGKNIFCCKYKKTKHRNRLKTSTVTAILHTKGLVNRNKYVCLNFPIPKEIIRNLNQHIYDQGRRVRLFILCPAQGRRVQKAPAGASFTFLILIMKLMNINISDLRGQSYDNGANMRGRHNGLQQKFLK